jgi:membrane fusion protein, heavy metal efflux system
MKTKLLILFTMTCLISCQHKQTDIKPAGTAYSALEPLSITVFTANVELFAEFRPFVKDQETSFAAHLNDLKEFKPFSTGSLQVILKNERNTYENKVDAPSVPGIYRPVITPSEPGLYTLTFIYNNYSLSETISVDSIRVYQNISEIHPAATDNKGDNIVYLKEQAWKTTFATEEVVEKPFYSVISTSARVKSQPSAEMVLSSQAAGQINIFKVVGETVLKGDLIATVSGGSLENNLSIKLNENRIAYEKSKADYDRTKPLTTSQTISQKDFLEIVTKYRQDSVRYFQFAGKVSENAMKLVSPVEGIISDIMVDNGGYIETGLPVARITNSSDLLIEAFVNQSDHQIVSGIFDANFKDPSGNKTFTLSSLNGKVRSANAFVNDNSLRIPVNFTVRNNGDLMPGMFLEAYLMTNPKEKAIVVPYSSLLEEQGKYYVYVEIAGESFIKRQVTIAGTDGFNAEISSGLKPGERVVTKGVQPIKLSSMAAGLPLHGHTH